MPLAFKDAELRFQNLITKSVDAQRFAHKGPICPSNLLGIPITFEAA